MTSLGMESQALQKADHIMYLFVCDGFDHMTKGARHSSEAHFIVHHMSHKTGELMLDT